MREQKNEQQHNKNNLAATGYQGPVKIEHRTGIELLEQTVIDLAQAIYFPLGIILYILAEWNIELLSNFVKPKQDFSASFLA